MYNNIKNAQKKAIAADKAAWGQYLELQMEPESAEQLEKIRIARKVASLFLFAANAYEAMLIGKDPSFYLENLINHGFEINPTLKKDIMEMIKN
jgi:hypothetical protein